MQPKKKEIDKAGKRNRERGTKEVRKKEKERLRGKEGNGGRE